MVNVKRFEDIGEDNEICIWDNRENKEIGYWDFIKLVNEINLQKEMYDFHINNLKKMASADRDAEYLLDGIIHYMKEFFTDEDKND